MSVNLSKIYIAGFFDGDGSIGVYSVKDSYASLSFRIQLTQNKTKNSIKIFSYLLNKYGGNLSEQKTLSGNIKYNWQLNALKACRFLNDIKRYLILKKEQAELFVTWYKEKPKIRRDKLGRVVKFTKEELLSNKIVIDEMKSLKHQ